MLKTELPGRRKRGKPKKILMDVMEENDLLRQLLEKKRKTHNSINPSIFTDV